MNETPQNAHESLAIMYLSFLHLMFSNNPTEMGLEQTELDEIGDSGLWVKSGDPKKNKIRSMYIVISISTWTLCIKYITKQYHNNVYTI